MPSTFLTAEWKDLIMANYVIDPAILKPYIPKDTELDLYNGKAYVSLVGFMFNNTKVMGVKIPFHINFEEVNLRFYVKHYHQEEGRRGVVFIREIVPRPAIRIVANMLYREKYSTMPMKHFLKHDENQIKLGYHWKYKNKWNRIEAVAENTLVPILEGSCDEFIAEHYWGYSRHDERTTIEYAVCHATWKLYPIKSYLIDCDFKALYGDDFSILQDAVPDSVIVAEGSPVSVLHRKIIR